MTKHTAIKLLTTCAVTLFLLTGLGPATTTPAIATEPDLSWINQYHVPMWQRPFDIRGRAGYQQLPFPGNYDGLPVQKEMIAITDHFFRAAPAARGHTIINEYRMPHARAEGPTGMYISRFGNGEWIPWDEGLSAKLPPEIHRLLGTKPINIVGYNVNFVLVGTEHPRSTAWLKRVFHQMLTALNRITECDEPLDFSGGIMWPQYTTGCQVVIPRDTSPGYSIGISLATRNYCTNDCGTARNMPPGIYLQIGSSRIAENFQGGTTPTIIPNTIYLKK
jgi:hypothetical protein